jgi:hypothetical protein
MISLPIPDPRSPVRYRDIARVRDHAPRPNLRAHLDPDLDPAARPRPRGWCPVFGQEGAAQTVLARAGVGPGDVFLYFGWFRRGRDDLHAIFGWLEVGEVIDLARRAAPAWAKDHPHVFAPQRPNNALYIARRAGLFRRYDDRLRLTAPGATRSLWRVPRFFRGLGYHHDPRRWQGDTLRSCTRGQEFVLDAGDEARAWLRALQRLAIVTT